MARVDDIRPRARALRSLSGLLFMATGAGLVFALVIAMNLQSTPPTKETSKAPVAFEVERKPPKPKKKPKPRPRRQRRQTRRAPPAPVPDLAGALSGVDLGLRGHGPMDLGDASAQELAGAGAAEDLVMSEGAFDVPPKAVQRVAPSYPARARAKGVTGYVKLQLLVDERGRVDRVRVLEATPKGVFEQAAVQAVRQWRFQPGVYGGEPRAGRVTQVLRFELT
ncbi:MAG: energy transducer TonB [Myxococcota bacterium]